VAKLKEYVTIYDVKTADFVTSTWTQSSVRTMGIELFILNKPYNEKSACFLITINTSQQFTPGFKMINAISFALYENAQLAIKRRAAYAIKAVVLSLSHALSVILCASTARFFWLSIIRTINLLTLSQALAWFPYARRIL
jgi:hypothetical protein